MPLFFVGSFEHGKLTVWKSTLFCQSTVHREQGHKLAYVSSENPPLIWLWAIFPNQVNISYMYSIVSYIGPRYICTACTVPVPTVWTFIFYVGQVNTEQYRTE